MVSKLAFLLSAAFLDQAPRAITGALGVQLGAVASDAELERLGFTGRPGQLLWLKEQQDGHFQVMRIGRTPSGHVVSIVLERHWDSASGFADCQMEQAGLADLAAAAWPSLAREQSGPVDIRFVTLREPMAAREARSLSLTCSHIPGRVLPTLRVVWRVSPAERASLYAGASDPGTE